MRGRFGNSFLRCVVGIEIRGVLGSYGVISTWVLVDGLAPFYSAAAHEKLWR